MFWFIDFYFVKCACQILCSDSSTFTYVEDEEKDLSEILKLWQTQIKRAVMNWSSDWTHKSEKHIEAMRSHSYRKTPTLT